MLMKIYAIRNFQVRIFVLTRLTSLTTTGDIEEGKIKSTKNSYTEDIQLK